MCILQLNLHFPEISTNVCFVLAMLSNTLWYNDRLVCTQAEGSSLAARFNGSDLMEQCLDRDDQGRIFLDFDPYCFQQILFYLRSRALLSSAEATAALPEIDPCIKHAYMDLVKFLLLEECMGYSGFSALQFVQASSGVQIMREGQTAKVVASSSSYRTVMNGPSLGNVCFFKCKIHQMEDEMFLGLGEDLDGRCNHHASSTHGWDNSGQQYIKGKQLQQCFPPKVHWANGDWVLIKADFLAGKLSMVSTQVSTPLTIPLKVPAKSQDQSVFQVNLYGSTDQVELLPVTAEDEQLLSHVTGSTLLGPVTTVAMWP